MDKPEYLVDSNILLRWVQPGIPSYPLVQSAIEAIIRRGETLWYTTQNVAEFWNGCTRPVERNGYGLTPFEADRLARRFENRLKLLPESAEVHQEWRRMLVAHSISGVQVHDARLAAAMQVYGVERILTFNAADFVRFPRVQAVHPRDIIAEYR